MRVPATPPSLNELMAKLLQDPEGFKRIMDISMAGVGPLVDGKYRHWDILRHLQPPESLSSEEWWFAIKNARRGLLHELPIKDRHGSNFRYGVPDIAIQMLHEIDSDARGSIRSGDGPAIDDNGERYLLRTLMEEAITSSQLEGASTTREVAKEMIQSGRSPRDRSELMIYNNHIAMGFIRWIKDRPLTTDLVLTLQRMVTSGTLDDPSGAGRFRRDDERIAIYDNDGNQLHIPPPADELSARMSAMCDFANGVGEGGFIHPVIRAIILHFWLAYDHPFVDGNGRTARALFYWSMARQGYWLCEFISISRILNRSPGRYGRAFLYTESDDNDATYFILNQMEVIIEAIHDLHHHLLRKQKELVETKEILQRSRELNAMLNHRQLALINHALRRSRYSYTIKSHRMTHNVSYHTARTDLMELAGAGLLEMRKAGKELQYHAPSDLRQRLEGFGEPLPSISPDTSA